MADAAAFLGAFAQPPAAPPTAQEAPPAVEAGGNLQQITELYEELTQIEERQEWSLPIAHLSASSLGMWARCPEQWRRRYVLGEKEAPGAALVVGTSFHFAQETNFRQKIESHEDIAVEKVVEAFHVGWDKELERFGGAGEISWDPREKPDSLRQKGAALAGLYRTQVSPTLQPETVEHGFLMPVEGVPVPIKGFIDFVGTRENGVPWDDNYASVELLIDYKTSAKSMRELKPEWGLQARLYQMETGRRVEYHVAVKTKDPSIITPVDAPALALEVSETAANVVTRQMQRFTAQMSWYYSKFGPDQAWPSGAPFYGWACGYCGFAPTCVWQQS